MALSIESSPSNKIIDVDEFIELAASRVDPEDFQSLFSVIDEFAALNNNRNFLVQHFNSEPKKVDVRRLAQYLSPQSYVFGASKCGSVAVRCNIWVKPDGSAEKQALEARIFSYGLAHNHNFSFLTVGYSGPGYRSKIYEVDPDSVSGYIGESVKVQFLEDTVLPKGKMMIYRRGIDVHTQLPPEDISVSLNLLMAAPSNSSVVQYYVDTQTGVIIGFPEVNTSSKRLTLLSLAKALGDENTVDLLDQVVKTSQCFRTRVGAANAILGLLPATEAITYTGSLPFDPSVVDVSIGQGHHLALARSTA
jgi:hypothetical protein